jgi:hypothetical protein
VGAGLEELPAAAFERHRRDDVEVGCGHSRGTTNRQSREGSQGEAKPAIHW